MKNILLTAATCAMCVSCINTSFIMANRSNITETRQNAQEDGRLDNSPSKNSNSLAAEKNTELDAAVSTSSGTAKTSYKSGKADSADVSAADSQAVKEETK